MAEILQTQSDLAFRSTSELSDLMQRRELSPVELLDHCLDRIERLNPELNAFVKLRSDQARAEARESEDRWRRGEPRALEGISVPIKDNVAVAGCPMSMGSRMGVTFDMPADAELVARLRRAGAVIPGKTNLPEFGTIPSTEGELHGASRNPWDVTRTAGGSSGGAAVAVASGMAPIAHGNDGGGSLRVPAACCGLFSLKPSRGRVPHGPFETETIAGLTIDGFISRSVRDNARLLDVIAGPVPGDPYPAPRPARPFEEEAQRDPGRLRIAWTSEAPLEVPVHPAHVAAVRDAAELCASLGHTVEEATPDWRDESVAVLFIQLWASLIGSTIELLAEVGGDPGTIERHNAALHQLARELPANRLGVTITRLHQYAWRVSSLWERFDVVLTPTLAEPPLELGTLFELSDGDPLYPLNRAGLWIPFLPLLNVTGQPAANLPLSWHEGLPVGVQMIGRMHDEATLYRLSAQLESARPWSARRPPVS
jgi:amidase